MDLKNSLEISKELLDDLLRKDCELGMELFRDFMLAKTHRNDVDCRMKYAYYSSQSRYVPEDECKLDGPAIFIGIFARLRSIFLAWHFDRVEKAGENLFTIRPSPVVEAPESMKQRAIDEVMNEVLQSGLPPEMAVSYSKQRISELKTNVFNKLYKAAEKATERCKTHIMDDMVEGQFLEEYYKWWDAYVTYPYAVMQFPVVETKTKMVWKRNKLVAEDKSVVRAKFISPMDFWVTPDCTTTNDGKAVFVKERISYSELTKLKKLAKGAVAENLDTLLNGGDQEIKQDWYQEDNEKTLEESTTESGMTKSTSWDMIKCWTKMTGFDLKEYGVDTVFAPNKKKVVDTEEYTVEAWMLDKMIIYVAPTFHPTGDRPFYVASWQPVHGAVYGRGMYDCIASIEKAGNLTAREMLKNASLSAGYIAEIDQSRFEEGAEPRNIAPFTMYRTQGYEIGAGQTALKFHTIPSASGSLAQLHDWLSQKASRAAGIEDFMAGAVQDAGSAVRTNMGVQAVQGNGTKMTNMRANTADKFCFLPMFRDWWRYLMLYSEDETIKVDAEVDIKGLTSVTAKAELESRSIELLQYLPAFMQAAQMQGIQLDPKFTMGVLKSAAGQLGGDIEYLADPDDQAAIQGAVGAAGGATPMPVPDGRSATPQTADMASQLPPQ